MADNPRIGSRLDEFLEDEGLLPEVSATAMKRVIAWRIADAMKQQGVSKSAMAERMRTSRSQLDRILDASDSAMTLDSLSRALGALGLGLTLEIAERPASYSTAPASATNETLAVKSKPRVAESASAAEPATARRKTPSRKRA